jgi:predicted phage terminase large subunit-like protein
MVDFSPQDIPNLDDSVSRLPTDLLRDMAEYGKSDLYWFNNAVLRYKEMTVDCHGPLCAFVQHNPKQFKRILMPRDHFKSTLITIGGTLQKIVRNPDECIHIKNENSKKAERFLSAIQTHATGNKIFRTLYSSVVPPDTRKGRWNNEEADFVGRSGVYPEPTVSVSGMTSATTGAHFSHIVFDDPISRDAVQSELVMKEAIERLKDATSLLRRPLTDTIWLVGTRWAMHDVYSWWDDTYGLLTGKFSRAAIEDGQVIFPQLISLDFLDMKRREDEYLFSCNYMNNPRNGEIQDLDTASLVTWVYTDASEKKIALYNRQGQVITIIPVDRLEITATVDLAPAEKTTSDRNAVVVLGVDPPTGYAIILDVFAKRCTPLELIDHLFDIHKRWSIWKLGIEGVAYQKAFKYFLSQECERRNAYMNIVELKAQGKKEVRIRGLQPLIKVSRVAAHPTQQLLKQEMADFPLGQHDDTVDALSMQLQIAGHWFSEERMNQIKKAEQTVLKAAGVLKDPLEEDDASEFSVLDRYANQSTYALG